MSHARSRFLVIVVAPLAVAGAAVAPGLVGQHPARPRAVAPGIDVLLSDSAHLVRGRRLGLVTNVAAVDAAGVPTVDRLTRSSLAQLVAVFTPEHGLRAAAPPGEPGADSLDATTGLAIYSLYGPRRAPTTEQLAGLDLLVVDLPDVGARPFTYLSTTIEAMRAVAAARKPILVLDRPNPIGCALEGPLLDPAYGSFIGMLRVPLRHGMTIGELARLANVELGIGAALTVVPVRGWRRCQWLDETGLRWVRPSPNLPDLGSAAWYPGTVLFEATNLSVGRGTDRPFRQVGAPWLDAPRVAREMARRFGVRVVPVDFTPRSPGDGKFDGVAVRGVRLPTPARRDRYQPVQVSLRLLDAIAAIHRDSFRLDSLGLARRLGVWPSGRTEWPEDLAEFAARRRPHLLYP